MARRRTMVAPSDLAAAPICAECLTVADGTITHLRIIFDRLPFDAARRGAAQSARPVAGPLSDGVGKMRP